MNLSRITALTIAQVAETRRDFGAVFLSFIFPLFFVLTLIGSMLITPVFTVDIGLVNADTNPEARGFADALATQNVTIHTLSAAEATAGVEAGELNGVVTFPQHWTPEGSEPLTIQASGSFAGVAETLVQAARAKVGLPDTFQVETRVAEQSRNAEFNFIYPGMLALALVQLGLFMTATPILKARDRGTLRYLLLTPLTTGELVASQVAFRLCIAAMQIGLLLTVGSFIVDLDLVGWLATAGVAFIGVLMLISIGYVLSGLVNSAEAGMALIMIANFTLIFGGNIFWDPEGSTVLTAIATALPVSYLADAFRQIIVGVDGLWPIWLDLVVMSGWTLAMLTLARRTFSFDMSGRDLKPQRI